MSKKEKDKKKSEDESMREAPASSAEEVSEEAAVGTGESGEAAEEKEDAEEKDGEIEISEANDTPEASEKQESKGGLFGKRKDKKEEALKEKIAELEDKVKRQLAEFENFRNRTEKEKSQMFEAGARSVIEKLLPTIDSFERGLQTVGLSTDAEEKSADAAGASDGEKTAQEKEQAGGETAAEAGFAEGMRMVYKKFMTDLESIGVKAIPALGEPFDPNLHNAVMQDPDGEGESGTVTKELQKGYTYRDSVVRHSMVAVKN